MVEFDYSGENNFSDKSSLPFITSSQSMEYQPGSIKYVAKNQGDVPLIKPSNFYETPTKILGKKLWNL